jgi:hypothetical protein
MMLDAQDNDVPECCGMLPNRAVASRARER